MNLGARWNALPRAARFGVVAGAATVLALGAHIAGSGRLGGSYGDLQREAGELRARIASARGRIKEKSAHDRQLQALVNRTLGDEYQKVDSELRSRLNRIKEELKLPEKSFSVNTGEPTPRLSPRRSALNGAGRSKLRAEPDFSEVTATVAGEGSLEQALRLVHRIQQEPWLKRIDSLNFDPVKDGERQKVTIKLTTLFIPGMKPAPEATFPAYDPETFQAFATYVETNPFRVPAPPAAAPPPVAAVAAAPAAPTPAAGFPWHEWAVTIVAAGPTGDEVSLRNVVSGEVRRLVPGEKIGDALLLATNGDAAEFQISDERFFVSVGAVLSDRTTAVR